MRQLECRERSVSAGGLGVSPNSSQKGAGAEQRDSSAKQNWRLSTGGYLQAAVTPTLRQVDEQREALLVPGRLALVALARRIFHQHDAARSEYALLAVAGCDFHAA